MEMKIAALERDVAIEKEKLAREMESADKLFTTYQLSAEIAGVVPDLKELTKDEDGEAAKPKLSAYHAMTRAEVDEDEKVHCEENGSVLFSAQDNENPEDTADSEFYQLLHNREDSTQVQFRKVMPIKAKPTRTGKKKQQFNFAGLQQTTKRVGPNSIKKPKKNLSFLKIGQPLATDLVQDLQKKEGQD